MRIRNLLLFFILLNPLFAMGQKDYQMLVSIDLEECINCFAPELGRLDTPFNDVAITIVMPEKFRRDSALAIKRYNLRGITKNIVWSDKLVEEISPNGLSGILFTSKYKTMSYRFPLKGMPSYFIEYLKRVSVETDTLLRNYPNVSSFSKTFYNNENKIYFINKLRNAVTGYDLMTGEEIMDFTIPDSILQSTYARTGYKAELQPLHHRLMQRAHFNPIDIECLTFNKDTVLVRFTSLYFTVKHDTILNRDNVWILQLAANKTQKKNAFKLFFDNQFDNNRLYISSGNPIFGGMYYRDKRLYSLLYTSGMNKDKYGYNYPLGGFELNAQKEYEFSYMLPKKNSFIYDNGKIGCETLTFDSSYFAVPLLDTLFSLTDKEQYIPLDFLSNYQPYEIEACSKGIAIQAFKLTNDYAWVLIMDLKTKNATVLKRDLKTNENKVSKKVLKDFDWSKGRFDALNPDYLIYIDKNGAVIRQKMF